MNGMSLVIRKTVFGVCDQVRLKPVCSATETSWGLESLDIASRGIILSSRRNKGVGQTARMRRLICAFVVRIWQKQVFSWHGSYSNPGRLAASHFVGKCRETSSQNALQNGQ